jgi:hypothetical protein
MRAVYGTVRTAGATAGFTAEHPIAALLARADGRDIVMRDVAKS